MSNVQAPGPNGNNNNKKPYNPCVKVDSKVSSLKQPKDNEASKIGSSQQSTDGVKVSDYSNKAVHAPERSGSLSLEQGASGTNFNTPEGRRGEPSVGAGNLLGTLVRSGVQSGFAAQQSVGSMLGRDAAAVEGYGDNVSFTRIPAGEDHSTGIHSSDTEGANIYTNRDNNNSAEEAKKERTSAQGQMAKGLDNLNNALASALQGKQIPAELQSHLDNIRNKICDGTNPDGTPKLREDLSEADIKNLISDAYGLYKNIEKMTGGNAEDSLHGDAENFLNKTLGFCNSAIDEMQENNKNTPSADSIINNNNLTTMEKMQQLMQDAGFDADKIDAFLNSINNQLSNKAEREQYRALSDKVASQKGDAKIEGQNTMSAEEANALVNPNSGGTRLEKLTRLADTTITQDNIEGINKYLDLLMRDSNGANNNKLNNPEVASLFRQVSAKVAKFKEEQARNSEE